MLASNSQEAFIGIIKSALSNVADEQRSRHPFAGDENPDTAAKKLTKIQNRPKKVQLALLDTLREQAKPLNLQVVQVENESHAAEKIRELILGKDPEWGNKKQIATWRHPLVDKLNLENLLKDDPVQIHPAEYTQKKDKEIIRKQIRESFVGITAADYCVADSATLVLKTRKGQPRSISLVPSIHIAVIRLRRIVADLKELYLLLKWDPEERKEGMTRCLTFITGPSKTADIEATMVHGAHGPREVHIFVVTG